MMLVGKTAPKENIVVTGARVLDPAAGVDAQVDVRVDNGVIAAIGTNLDRNGHRVIDAAGPCSRPPSSTRTCTFARRDARTKRRSRPARGAAAGGYCAILAMPNTDPVVDSAAVLGSLLEQAREHAEIPVGFLAAITKGQRGGELTDMAARGRGRRRLHRRRPARSLGRAHATRAAVLGDHRSPPRAARGGAVALQGRPDARGRGLRRARLHRLPVGRREPDGRARSSRSPPTRDSRCT